MRQVITIVTAFTLLATGLMAQQRRQQDVDLQRAIRTETADRDCGAAIKQYAAIVSKYASDRATVATALIHQADCYRRLGDSQARAIYDRVVREFGDRKEEVAVALERLGVGVGVEKRDRAVWTGPNVDSFGRISADGRYLTYTDWDNGRLMLRNLATGMDRELTPGSPEYRGWPEFSVLSPDGKQVAYTWWTSRDEQEFRIASLVGSGLLTPRSLITGRFSHTSLDWSPDGSWISAARRVPDESVQIGLISVKDGSFRVLKSAPASAFGATNSVEVSTRFSPDGRYVAYHRPAADRAQQQDIFVIEIESGREVPAVVHDADDRLLAWSPIGSRLLFTSDRTESVGLWELPFGQGRAQGPARRLKPDFGSVVPLGLTSSGTLYVNKTTSNKDIAIAPVDLDAGRLLAPPSSFTQRFIDGASQAGSWSPDGQLLAVRCSGGCLAIRSTATGEVVRRLATTLAVIRWPNWSPDGRWLYACGIDRAGMEGIFRVDARTGDVSLVFMDDRLGSTLANVSPDGKKIYFNRRPGALIERDLASGAERELYRDSEADIRNGALSPNGRYVIIPRETGQRASFLIIPVDGGAPREVLRFAPPEKVFLASEWTPDSNAVIVLKHTGVRWELWKVPITGEPPRKLDIDPALWAGGIDTQGNLVLRGNSGFTVSRDGRRIAMVIGEDTSEVWAHENFLPAQGR